MIGQQRAKENCEHNKNKLLVLPVQVRVEQDEKKTHLVL
jgi:hypothetical protein